MKENKIYSCPHCKTILVIPKSCLQPSTVKCKICNKEMKLLDDEFDLSEIIEEDKYGLYFEKIYLQ